MQNSFKKYLIYLLAFIIAFSSLISLDRQAFAQQGEEVEEPKVESLPTDVPYKFDANWSSVVSSGVQDYHYENDDRSKIFITPTNNAPKTINWSVNFGFNYDNENLVLPEGSVKITVPSHLFENWNVDGNKNNVNVDLYERSLPVTNWQFPLAPNTSTVTDFNYVDNGDGTYTLTNYKELDSKFTLDFSQSFTFVPAYVKVDENSSLEKSYAIKVAVDMNKDGVNEIEDSRNLALSYQGQFNKGNVSISAKLGKDQEAVGFLSWQKSWGQRPADDDGKSYFYVVWFADYERGANTTLPFTSTITDTGSKEDTNGEVVGTGYYTWHDNTFKAYLNKDYPNLAKSSEPKSYRQYGNGIVYDDVLQGTSKFRVFNMQPRISQAILKRYPIDLIKNKSAKELSTTGITLSNTVRVDERADNGKSHILTAEVTENILLFIGEGSFGKYNVASKPSDIPNGRYMLLNDNPIRVASTWDGRSYSWNTPAEVNKKGDGESFNFKVREGAPYYISGNTKALGDKSLSELEAEGSSTKLKDEDYVINGFDVQISEYEASDTSLGKEKGNEIKDYSTISPVEVWVRKKNETTFTHYANVTRGTNGGYKFVDTSGNPLEKSVNNITRKLYPLPEDVVEIEYRHESKNFTNIIQPFTSLVINPTENVKSLLKSSIENKEDSLITSQADLYYEDEKIGDTNDKLLKFSLYKLNDLQVNSMFRKYSENLVDIKEEGRQKLSVIIENKNLAFNVYGNITGTGKSDSEVLKGFIFNKGSFYDLLPKGTYIDENTHQLKLTWIYNNKKPHIIPKENYSVRFIENYKDTGMTMMVVDYEIPEDLLRVQMDSTVIFTYDLYNNYDNIIDRGADVINSVAFVNGNEDVPMKAYGANSTPDKMTFKDAYGSLYADNLEKSMFTEAKLNYNAVTVSQSGFSKTSSADAKLGYNKNSTVRDGGNYSYRLRFTQAKETKSDNIVFYDILENGSSDKQSQWKGNFVSVDVSSLESKNDAINKSETLKPVVYYATTLPSEDQFDLSLSNIWSTQKPDDLSKVKAIAVDATKTNKGNAFTLDNGSSLSVFINMTAPSDISLNNKKAINLGAVKARNFYQGSSSSNQQGRILVDDASVSLSIPTTNLSVSKSWQGISDENIKDAQVRVRLYKNGEETDKTLLLNKKNNFTANFENLKKYYYVDDVEKENIYTVKELNEANEPIEEGGTTIVNGKEFLVSYDGASITNTLVNPKINISGAKTWEDENNQDGIRPDEIRVKLYANARDVIKALSVSSASGWTYTFDDLPTYDNEGNLMVYTVMEDLVEGYVAEVSGYNLTNRHTPQKIDIGVSKTWIDNENIKNLRPEKIKISLLAHGQKVQEKEVDETQGWQTTFTDLPKYKQGKEIVYTVSEEAVENYIPSYAGSMADGFTITNTLTGKIDIDVSKSWIGKEGKEATIKLLKNGEVAETVNLNKDREWKHTFANLDQYENGREITYTIEEEDISGYTKEIKGSAKEGYEVINTYSPKSTSYIPKISKIVEGKKDAKDKFDFFLWEVKGESEEKLEEISIIGSSQGSFKSLTFNMPGTYTYKIRELEGDLKNYEYDKSEYIITIKVEDVDGNLEAKSIITKDGAEVDSIVFTNKYKEGKKAITNTGDENNLASILLIFTISLLSIIRLIFIKRKNHR